MEFYFCHVKHERCVHAKSFKKPRRISNGMCDSNVGNKSRI
jgi:hypothetical protein